MEKSYSTKNHVKSIFSLNNKVIFVLLSVLLMTMTTVSTTVHAGGESCSKKGTNDGENHPFSQGTYGKCGDNYYKKFVKGCMSEGNTKDTCETATDG